MTSLQNLLHSAYATFDQHLPLLIPATNTLDLSESQLQTL